MWNQFFFINIHFALSVVASLIYFLVAWLYFDAWTGRKSLKDAFKIVGFVLLSVSSIIHASHIDSTVLQTPFLDSDLIEFAYQFLYVLGLFVLGIGLFIDPILKKPDTSNSLIKNTNLSFFNLKVVVIPLTVLLPVLSSMVGLLYLRRSTIGYENHLRLVSLSFFILSFGSLVGLSSLFYDTSNIQIFKLIAPYSVAWIIEHILYAVSIGSLSFWVFGYLLKRLQSQLFVFFSGFVIVIFVVMTMSFSALILKNLESETLKQIRTNAKVLQFTLESKASENTTDAVSLAQNPSVVEGVTEDNSQDLAALSEAFLVSKQKSSLLILNADAQVIARGEKSESIGDSFSEDVLVQKALLGDSVSSIQTYEGVLAPIVAVRSAVAIVDGKVVVGVVVSESILDNAFVDKIHNATGLAASVYAGSVLSATTLVEPDGKNRANGQMFADEDIGDSVLKEGNEYVGAIKLQGVEYFASILPMNDIDNTPVGMILVALPQIGLLKAAARAIEITFLVALIIEVLSLVPAFFLSRYISKQIN